MEDGHCPKCGAGILIAIGVLVLVWNWYITGMGDLFAKDWPTFIGVFIVLIGILSLSKPPCCHTVAKPAAAKKPAPKKKK